jgi:hypothetical protein
MQQPTEKPKWLFKLGKAISTVYCRNSQKQINVANGYKNSRWSTVFYFALKARKGTCFCFKNLVLCLNLLSNLEKQESIILWLINSIGCVN